MIGAGTSKLSGYVRGVGLEDIEDAAVNGQLPHPLAVLQSKFPGDTATATAPAAQCVLNFLDVINSHHLLHCSLATPAPPHPAPVAAPASGSPLAALRTAAEAAQAPSCLGSPAHTPYTLVRV